jgi:hypothetical protein
MMGYPTSLADEAVDVCSSVLFVVGPARIRHVPEPPSILEGIVDAPQAVLTDEFVGTVDDFGVATIEPVDV